MSVYDRAFDIAHEHVAKWEGGYFNHPNDPGGVTNYGISLMFLKSLGLVEGDIDGDGDIDADDVKAITKENARTIFRKHFWDIPHAERLPPLIAIAYYDFAVNAGTGRAAIVLQQAINELIPSSIAKYAANLGPLTQKFCNELSEDDNGFLLALMYIGKRIGWYRRLAVAKPRSAVFLKGWLNRSNDMRRLVVKVAMESNLE